jgi:ABC-type transporter Mla maintaining outer membrane lipid asymmetry ATPase subunit MlaF
LSRNKALYNAVKREVKAKTLVIDAAILAGRTRGENIVVIGRSGIGKSVLIKCIVGLVKADEGIIRVLGQDITKLKGKKLDALRKKIGF